MRKIKKLTGVLAAVLLNVSIFSPLQLLSVSAQEQETIEQESDEESSQEGARDFSGEIPEIPGLEYESMMDLTYAEGFDVFFYQDGYALIDVYDSARYLVVPEDMPVPENLDEDIVILQKPLTNIYLAASSSMALFDALDALDTIRLSALNAGSWYIEDAVSAMEAGDILFAGKYSEPDYELLINEQCTLAIESTMILHSPKVQEMIENMGIPVFIDRSSYENHPLGRTEWIKVYGVLTDKEEEAEAFFEKQASVIADLKDFQNTEKTVAFFYVSTDGLVVVRKSTDYIPKMIEIAGGRYAFENLDDTETKRSAVSMTMEEFYATAVNADYLIYNATVDSPISSLEELYAKSDLFRDFKAVQEDNVWCAGKYLYQATDIVGNMIQDIHLMLTDGDESQMTFMTKIS
jgi:iron complex transport system substrate-binding protein